MGVWYVWFGVGRPRAYLNKEVRDATTQALPSSGARNASQYWAPRSTRVGPYVLRQYRTPWSKPVGTSARSAGCARSVPGKQAGVTTRCVSTVHGAARA
eukprot:3937404-Rhodomonas_salina.2